MRQTIPCSTVAEIIIHPWSLTAPTALVTVRIWIIGRAVMSAIELSHNLDVLGSSSRIAKAGHDQSEMYTIVRV